MRPSAWFYSVISLVLLSLSVNARANIEAQTYTLNNGLELVVVEDHRAPVVMSQVWYKVGSAYEPPGLTGLSHMLEHMMFKGTSRFPGDTLIKLISDNGGRFNAQTGKDHTSYYEFLPADKLALSFELEADRMVNLQLRQADFVTENQVVQEERRMRIDDDPPMVAFERLNAAAHVASPYHHLTIGWMRDIKQYTLDDLTHWYRQWYAPNNAVVIVVGDVKPDEVYRLAIQYFGKLAANRNIPVLKRQPELTMLGERRITVNVLAKVPEVMIAYNVPSITYAEEKWQPYALELVEAILSDGDSARLQRDLVRKQQIVASVNVGFSSYRLFPSLFLIDAVPAKGKTPDLVIAAIEKHIQQLQSTLIDKDELAKVKNQVVANNIFGQDSVEGKAGFLGSIVSLGLPWQTVNTYVDHINAITPEQIQKVAKQYLTKDRRTIAVLVPTQTTAKKG